MEKKIYIGTLSMRFAGGVFLWNPKELNMTPETKTKCSRKSLRGGNV